MANKTEATIQLHICKNISLCTYVLQPGTLTANFEAAKKPVLAALKEKYGINAKESEIKVFSPTGAKSLRNISNAHVSNQVLQVNLISTALKKEFETLQTQAPSPSLPLEAESSSSDLINALTLDFDKAIQKLQKVNKKWEILKESHEEDIRKIQEDMNKMCENMKKTSEEEIEKQLRASNDMRMLNDERRFAHKYFNKLKQNRKTYDSIVLRTLAKAVQKKIENGCHINVSEDALTLLDEILRQGNAPKNPDEIRKAIKESGPDMPLLKELFEFAYNFSLEE